MPVNTQAPTRTVVLLGASNLTLGWQPIVKVLRSLVPQPLDLRVAFGMGRSYVGWSGFWFRRLPGIPDCGLWSNLPGQITLPPLVLITDLGNDLGYGHHPKVILQGVEKCVETLRSWRPDVQIVMTGPPLQALHSMKQFRFLAARTVLFPHCRMTLSDVRQRSEELENEASLYAQKAGIAYTMPELEWYGWDPIHVLPKFRDLAFRRYFSHWPDVSCPAQPVTSTVERIRLPITASRKLFGVPVTTNQPSRHGAELRVSAW